MQSIESSRTNRDIWAKATVEDFPLAVRILSRGVDSLNRFFDWLYHSEWNPFYRSGTLAMGLLVVLVVTGVILLFFYQVGDPHLSMVNIQTDLYFGRWLRALHRYATDAMIIAVFFHVLQMAAQGKTWGPRTLAWVSGVFLMFLMMISAWTGYVLVWDEHALLLAQSGAQLLATFPLLRDLMLVAFDGTIPVSASFFFMNLFLHVALPLGILIGFGVHTMKLARTVWFPPRANYFWSIAALTTLAILIPVPLGEEANLLRMTGKVPTDIFVGFWIPFIQRLSPIGLLSALTMLALLMVSVPIWWRPSSEFERKRSQVIDDKCTGCTQCARDCPYEAISMVPNLSGKHLLAKVNPTACVSCGICAASCDELAIGPPGRDGAVHLKVATELAEHLRADSKIKAVAISCVNNRRLTERLEQAANVGGRFYHMPVECCGTLHSSALEKLLEVADGVFIVGCAARNCTNRDGLELLKGRVYERRVPFLNRSIDRSRIFLTANSEQEGEEALWKLNDFIDRRQSAKPNGIESFISALKRTSATVIVLAFIALGNSVTTGVSADSALLRLSVQLPSEAKATCRPLNDEEKASIPKHMQPLEICMKEQLSYSYELRLNGNTIKTGEYGAGTKGDGRLITLRDEVVVPLGDSAVEVEIIGRTAGDEIKRFRYSGQQNLRAGEIMLITFDEGSKSLRVVK